MPVQVDFAKGSGLVPVVVQELGTGDVLMVAYMNEAALEETVRTGRACYFSRSRDRLWRKGETSGPEAILLVSDILRLHPPTDPLESSLEPPQRSGFEHLQRLNVPLLPARRCLADIQRSRVVLEIDVLVIVTVETVQTIFHAYGWCGRPRPRAC